MRISTSQIYDAGTLGIQNGQSSLYKLQNQLSTGRRVLTPQDDPVAASQALIVTQSMEVNKQHIDNQGQAKSQLGLIDSQTEAMVNALQNVRDRVIQAGNSTLSQSDRESIATELDARLNEMLGIANSDNGVGEFLFSGYKGNVRPFSIAAPIPPATTGQVDYFGDEGERLLQVSASRQMAVSVSGSELFQNIKNGNGTFVTDTGGNLAPPPAFTLVGNNKGSATVDQGSVLDSVQWSAAGNPGKFMVRFSITATGTTEYQLYDNTTPTAPVALLATPASFTPGQAIVLKKTTVVPAVDYGASMTISGQPKDGDSFTVAPSTRQGVFKTMQNLIGILRSPVGASSYTTTQFTNDLGAELANIDQALANVSRVQSDVGTKLQEIDSLGSASTDVDIQYKSSLSDLQDLDYAKAISDFVEQQTNLEAAQKSFAQISGLSLFKYL